MTSRIIPVSPFDYVVFGATGDLTARKLIPALFYRFQDGQFDERSRVIGVSRSPLSNEQFRDLARKAVMDAVAPADRDEATLKRFLSCFSYVANDVLDEEGWS